MDIAKLRKTFLQALDQFLSNSVRFQSENIIVPDQLQLLNEEKLIETVQILYSREAQYVRDYFIVNGVEEHDCDDLINRIEVDLRNRFEDRSVHLEVRNILAVSGNATIIHCLGQIIKYPLNEIFAFMIAPEIANHQRALDIYEEWRNDAGSEQILGFIPKLQFRIPYFQYIDDIYSIEFVGKSLDMRILIDLIFCLDMNIETRMKRINPHVQTLYQESTPAQLQYLLQTILAYNIPALREINLSHTELLSLLLNTYASYISREQYWALNSFLDYSWDRGFKYMDKTIDNVTLHNDKLYLIDFGLCGTFNPRAVNYKDKHEYDELRREMVENQLTPFIMQS